MDLNQYVAQSSQAELAKLLGIAPSFVNQWVSGKRPIPITICVEIEQKTNGKVTRKELRPYDWKAIWPELADDCKHEEMTGNTCDVCGETMPDFVGP